MEISEEVKVIVETSITELILEGYEEVEACRKLLLVVSQALNDLWRENR